MKYARRTAPLFVFLLFTTVTAHAWKLETVDPDPKSNTGLYTSLALDSSDKVHISYIDWTNGRLVHATNASGAWVLTGVKHTPDAFLGLYTSLALDSSDRPHIGYIDWTSGKLIYAVQWIYPSWFTFSPVSPQTPALCPSLALDSADKVHISYYDVTNHDLRHTTNHSGSWITEAVDWMGEAGMYGSVAVDGSDKAHVSYWGDGGLTYATNASGAWVTTILDPDENGGIYTSLALGSSGTVHISYYDVTNQDLKYATNASGAWALEALDSDADVGWDTSLALDGSGKVHISYYDVTNADLKHVTNASGAWVAEVVDSSGDVGMFSSLAVDSRGYLRISYYDKTNRNPKYAFTTPCIDNDGDGYGDLGDPWCPKGPETDCDDANRSRNPGASEICDGLDNDCDGNVPSNEVDEDEDGYRICANDCDDDNPEVNPRIVEGPFRGPLCSDGMDNDCDGKADLEDSQCCECIDNDRDGYGQTACMDCADPRQDCDDAEPDVNPGMKEKCANGIDDDCDGRIDNDDRDCESPPCTAAEASVVGSGPPVELGGWEVLALLLVPIGGVTLRKMLRRR